ncbi:MAG: sigma-70 family RNA polymerase sigma factor [Acidipropionibacterium sp.]|jgi:RNA polymerase sigma factor (sigma-70 family)|nr:sigma-70 family RNA polymerase sigma factor [Acidipropionibacterium sp.]
MDYRAFINRGNMQRLSPQQEGELFTRMEAGLVARAVLEGRHHSVSEASREELELLAEQGERARERLWQSSLPLALKISGDMGRSWTGASDDLLQAACVGLAEALLRYDLRRGLKFSTFAWSSIRRRVSEEVMRQGSARPVWRRRTERAVERKELLLTIELGRQVEDADIASALDVDVSWVRERRGCSSDLPVGELWLLEGLMSGAGESEPDVDWLAEAREHLPRLQRLIIDSHFGFDGQMTPRHELAAELGLSERAVRRMERSALDSLRTWAQVHRDVA